MLKIISAKDANLSSEEFNRLFNIITIAYAQTEVELWGENYFRVLKETYRSYLEKDEILIAFLEGDVVGGIHIYELKPNIWTFSLLGADFNHAGKGIGRALVKRAEEEAISQGASEMHIEVLRASDIEVKSKTIVGNWYVKQGYKLVKQIEFAEIDASKADELLIPAHFDCYLKVF